MRPAKMSEPLDIHASEFVPGLTVVEASAGTGKTYSISHLVPRLLIDGTLPDLSRLLLVTFTNDAARELADRVRRMLTVLASAPGSNPEPEPRDTRALRRRLEADPAAQARLRQAMTHLDQLAVSTIHAFCQRTLQQEGALCGLPVLPELVTDDSEHLLQALRQEWIDGLKHDARMATTATVMEWSPKTAASVARHLRRAPAPRPEPTPRPLAEVRQELESVADRLRIPSTWEEASMLVANVPKWNKDGPVDSEDAVARLRPLHEAPMEDATFWIALRNAAKVWKKIGGGQKFVDPIKACDWYKDTLRLEGLVQELEWSWQHELAARVHDRMDRTLRQHRLITQDGLIDTLHRALHPSDDDGGRADRLATRLADRHHVALVDESQDTDPRQFGIFRRIFLRPNQARRLILVGDPKQAIYGFRGADLSTYLAARDQAGRQFALNRTFRSPQPLVAAINQLFAGDRPFLNGAISFQPAASGLEGDVQLIDGGAAQSRVELWLLPSEGEGSLQKGNHRVRGLSAAVATTVTSLLNRKARILRTRPGDEPVEQEVTPADFAVLVSTNAQADAMAEALQQRGVPVVVNSGADVFDTDEARDLKALLEAILDPRRKTRLRAALATRLIGLDATKLGQFAVDDPAPAGDATAEATAWLDLFTHWQARWQKDGLATLLAELDRPCRAQMQLGVTHRLALTPLTGERRATNYRHLTDLLLQASREEAPGPDELVHWLAQQVSRAGGRAASEEAQLRLSTDRKAVQVLTMHSCKGLQFPLVFCPYLAEPLRALQAIERLPDGQATVDGMPQGRLVRKDLLDKAELEEVKWESANAQLEERLRLAYVALTRAEVRVWTASYTTSSKGQGGPRLSPIDWLLGPRWPGGVSKAAVDEANADRADRHRVALTKLGATEDGTRTPSGEPPLITFRPPPGPDSAPLRPAAPTPEAGRRKVPAPPNVPAPWWVTSFSAFTHEKNPHGGSATSPGSEPAQDGPRDADAQASTSFFDAPGSAEVGTVVHGWIEGWDFGPVDRASLDGHLRSGPILRPPGPGEPAWGDRLLDLFGKLRDVRLPDGGNLPLNRICADPRASEWHFHLPIGADLSISRLAKVFEEHANEAHRPYADRLRELPARTTRGFLQGFIDRLFRDGEDWGVIDWKTNTLGKSIRDYDEAGMLRCAMESHYLLQCHLYLVALRRHLRVLGLPAERANRSYLVFLRAIQPGTTQGVLQIRPSDTMLDALDAMFASAPAP